MLESGRPLFFRQRRYGFNQQEFRIIKFRTMTALEDGDVVRQARRNDPRITRVGRFLRKWNIDELPQLINVLKGDMSLVGPRPHALSHNREYERKIALYARRHNVLPGITGWAQVNGLRGETDTDEKMRARVDHDLYYIDNWSLWFDLRILLRRCFHAGSSAQAAAAVLTSRSATGEAHIGRRRTPVHLAIIRLKPLRRLRGRGELALQRRAFAREFPPGSRLRRRSSILLAPPRRVRPPWSARPRCRSRNRRVDREYRSAA